MLRKSIVLCLASVILAAVPSAADQPQEKGRAQFQNYLPVGTLFVISAPDINQVKKLIEDPKFEKLLAAAGYTQFFETLLGAADMVLEQAEGISVSDIYSALGGELTVAVLEMKPGESPEILIAANLSGDAALGASIVAIMRAHVEENPQLEAFTTIGGVEVLQVDKATFAATRADVLFLCNSRRAMETVLAGGNPLSESPAFQRHARLCGLGDGITVYLDFAAFGNYLKSYLTRSNTGGPSPAELVWKLAGLDAIDSISARLPLDESGMMQCFVRTTGPVGIISEVFSSAPIDTGLFKLAPSDYDAFWAASVNRPLKILEAVLSHVEEINPQFKADQVDQMLAPSEEVLGIKLKEDLIGPLGGSVFSGVRFKSDVNFAELTGPADMLSLYDFFIGFTLDNPARLEGAMHKLAAIDGSAMTEEKYREATIYSIPLPAPVSVSLAVYDNNLLFCFGDETAKAVIDGIAGGDTMAGDPDVAAALAEAPKDATVVSYISDRYAVRSLETGFGTMLAKMDNETAAEFREILEAYKEYIGPQKPQIGYARPLEDGLFIEGEFPVRNFLGMIPIMAGLYLYQTTALEEAPQPVER